MAHRVIDFKNGSTVVIADVTIDVVIGGKRTHPEVCKTNIEVDLNTGFIPVNVRWIIVIIVVTGVVADIAPVFCM